MDSKTIPKGGSGGNIFIIARDSIKGSGTISADGGDGLIGGDGGNITLHSPEIDQNMTISANAGNSFFYNQLEELQKAIYNSDIPDRETYVNAIEQTKNNNVELSAVLWRCYDIFSLSTSVAPLIPPIIEALARL